MNDCYEQPQYNLKNIRRIQAELVLPVLTWRVQALHLQGNLQRQDWGSLQQQFKYEPWVYRHTVASPEVAQYREVFWNNTGTLSCK